jgi:methionyl-tRNA synthetase
MRLCDLLNQRWDEAKPWLLAKDPARADELQQVCSECLLGFYVVACALLPILPTCARARWRCSSASRRMGCAGGDLPDRVLAYEPLLTRIDPAQVEGDGRGSKEDLKPSERTPASAPRRRQAARRPTAASRGATARTIGIEDFARVDLRVGQVLECGFVEGSDKLLRFALDAGELGERQIFSGIRAGYPEPEKLVGRKVVFIANLAPRKMRFGVSEGMILSAGGDDGCSCSTSTRARPPA